MHDFLKIFGLTGEFEADLQCS